MRAKVFPGSGSNPAKVFAGSRVPVRSVAARYRDTILEKLELGLSVQRVFQDLQEEYGYAHSYESVKRYVRKLVRRRRAAGVMHSLPGEEAQIDFFQGAPTLDATTGQWRRPWVFRMTLCHSRHGYEEAVWDQKVETFLRLHERAFRDLGGVVKVVRHDNLKAAVMRACLYDPDVNVVYAAFSKHWGFTALPTRPKNPKEKAYASYCTSFCGTELTSLRGGDAPHELSLVSVLDRAILPRRLEEPLALVVVRVGAQEPCPAPHLDRGWFDVKSLRHLAQVEHPGRTEPIIATAELVCEARSPDDVRVERL